MDFDHTRAEKGGKFHSGWSEAHYMVYPSIRSATNGLAPFCRGQFEFRREANLYPFLVSPFHRFKNPANDFLLLADLIDIISLDTSINLARETKRALPGQKALGDRSSHNRHYLATKDDVDKVIPGPRVVVDDLLHLAKFK